MVAPRTFIFSTLGRYDTLGLFISIYILSAFGIFLYTKSDLVPKFTNLINRFTSIIAHIFQTVLVRHIARHYGHIIFSADQESMEFSSFGITHCDYYCFHNRIPNT